MKKLPALILAVCLALLLTVPAFADGRGPTFTSYDVVCTKSTPYYEEKWNEEDVCVMEKIGTFPSGTTLTVSYEYETDGVLYGNVLVESGNESAWYYIRLSDIELKDDVYLPENKDKLSRPRSVRVIDPDGVTMYTGPNKQYARLMTIPRGAKLTYNYSNDPEDYFRTWAYVTYFGRSGWIYVYASDTKNGLAELPDESGKAQIWVLSDDTKMYDGMSFGNIGDGFDDDWFSEDYRKELYEEPDRVVGTLEKGKTYTYRYSHAYDFGAWYYVTAGLRSGWVFRSDDTSRIAAPPTYNERDYFMTYKTLKLRLHSEPNEKAQAVTVTIPKETVLHPEYITKTQSTSYYYLTIDGQSGWFDRDSAREGCVCKLDADAVYFSDYRHQNMSDDAAPIYSDIMQRSKTVGKIPAGSLFTPLYNGGYHVEVPGEEYGPWFGIYYVRYNDVTGWVAEDDLYEPIAEETTEPEEESDDYDEQVEADLDAFDETDAVYTYEEPDYAPRRGPSALQIVLICIGCAAVLALTAAVTLLLIRRRRKAKNADSEPEAASAPQADDETKEP